MRGIGLVFPMDIKGVPESDRIRISDLNRYRRQDRQYCADLARIAVRCLHTELTLYPKPGLVSPFDNGSHQDMTAATFMRSLFALRHYFARIARAGLENAGFTTLKRLGIEAEQEMLVATGGVNTHRGAIFAVGMLCASVACCRAKNSKLDAVTIRTVLMQEWGRALLDHTKNAMPDSHGSQVAALHASSGAREEAALGFPSVFDVALPALQRAIAAGCSVEEARIDALFSLMAHVSDTNVYYRGGEVGALTVKRYAKQFLVAGGTSNANWKTHALDCHRVFVEQRLSPGGAADLLAVTCFVHEVISGV